MCRISNCLKLSPPRERGARGSDGAVAPASSAGQALDLRGNDSSERHPGERPDRQPLAAGAAQSRRRPTRRRTVLLAAQRGDLIFDAKLLAFKFRDYEVVGVRSV